MDLDEVHPTPSRINIINLRMPKHAGPSGYHHAGSGLDPEPILVSGEFSIPERIWLRLWRPVIVSSGSTWYHRDGFWGETRAAVRWLRGSRQVFHFLYGENLYRYLGVMKSLARRGNAIVATYHTPEWRMRELVRDETHIRKLDAIVVMSNSQREGFARIAPEVPVHFVPHGVNTDFFRPGDTLPDRFRFVCVGAHLRDFATFAAVARNFLAIDPAVEFHLVCNTSAANDVPDLPNIRKRTSVGDEELLRTYQDATALLLPLQDATANNALLEGMACGLPLITTDLPGVHDYTTEACRLLAPKGDADTMTELVRAVVNGQVDRVALGEASRRRAEELSWPNIRSSLRRLYASLGL